MLLTSGESKLRAKAACRDDVYNGETSRERPALCALAVGSGWEPPPDRARALFACACATKSDAGNRGRDGAAA